nr:hypothetical protein [Tanacetum cinerariifolium]
MVRTTCHSKDGGSSQGLYICRIVLRLDLSFDKSASPERLFSLARVSLVEASKPDLSFGWPGEDYTSSCPPSLHWKSGFFFIDRRAIPDAMVWRHPDVAIDDPRPAGGSFNMADVRRLSAHVIKLKDMPEGVLVLSGLSRVWKRRVCDPALQGVDGNGMGASLYCTPPTAVDAVIPGLTPNDLAVGTSSSKIVAKVEASQKRKASTSGATLSHVAKRTRSALAQSSGSTTRPSLFVGDDDEKNHGGSSATPTTKGSNPRDSRGKGIMVDDADASSAGASRPRPSSKPAPSFRNIFGDAIHMEFFPFFAGPYYATYPKDGVAGNYEFTREEWDASYRPTFEVLTKEVFKDPGVCKTIVDQFLIREEMVRVESLSDDQLTAKMSVMHCMMMSHGGELLARYRGLNQSHHEYVLSTDSRLKGYEEKVSSLTGLELQVTALKKQVFGLNDTLSSFDASFAKSKAKGKERKKKIKSLTKSVDNLHSKVARLSITLNQAIVMVWKFLASDEFSRVQGELLSLAVSAGFERGLSMHQTKDEFVAVLKKMANFMSGAQDRLAEASPLLLKLIIPFSTRSSSMLLLSSKQLR